MPLFDFKCRACGHEFEALVRPGDVATCPACQRQDLERILSSFAVSNGQLSNAAKRDVRRQGLKTQRDRVEYEKEIGRKHHDH